MNYFIWHYRLQGTMFQTIQLQANDAYTTLLAHAEQSQMGCMWYAAFAVTAQLPLLQYADELSNERFLCILAQYNWLERTWWNQALLEQPCDWEALATTIPADSLHGTGYRRLYLTYRMGKLHHCVGMLFPFNPDLEHIVSDSAKTTFQFYANRTAFLESPYARAHIVSEILDADLESYPSRLVSRGEKAGVVYE